MRSNRPIATEDLDYILTHSEALWRRLAGERLFITGGTGFFGVWLLASIAHANDRLGIKLHATVLTRSPQAFAVQAPLLANRPEFAWLAGDVRDFAFPEGGYSQIIHAATAASAQLNEAQPLEMFDVVVAGTRRVLEFAEHAGAANLLLTSSGAVYGRQPPELAMVPEDYPGAPSPNAPQSAYAEGKRAAELLCAFAHAGNPGLAPKIARCFAFVGPYLPLDAHFAVGNFLRDALEDRNIVIQGDGTPYRSYLHAADLVVWLLTILLRGQPNRPYNVGSDQAVSIAELARRVLANTGSGRQVEIRQAPGGGPAARYVPDISRARQELGLDIGIGLDEAIRRTWAWHQPSSP